MHIRQTLDIRNNRILNKVLFSGQFSMRKTALNNHLQRYERTIKFLQYYIWKFFIEELRIDEIRMINIKAKFRLASSPRYFVGYTLYAGCMSTECSSATTNRPFALKSRCNSTLALPVKTFFFPDAIADTVAANSPEIMHASRRIVDFIMRSPVGNWWLWNPESRLPSFIWLIILIVTCLLEQCGTIIAGDYGQTWMSVDIDKHQCLIACKHAWNFTEKANVQRAWRDVQMTWPDSCHGWEVSPTTAARHSANRYCRLHPRQLARRRHTTCYTPPPKELTV